MRDIIVGENYRRNQRGAAFVERRTMGAMLRKRYQESTVLRTAAQSQITGELEKGASKPREGG
jgi:hypothetical protein